MQKDSPGRIKKWCYQNLVLFKKFTVTKYLDLLVKAFRCKNLHAIYRHNELNNFLLSIFAARKELLLVLITILVIYYISLAHGCRRILKLAREPFNFTQILFQKKNQSDSSDRFSINRVKNLDKRGFDLEFGLPYFEERLEILSEWEKIYFFVHTGTNRENLSRKCVTKFTKRLLEVGYR